MALAKLTRSMGLLTVIAGALIALAALIHPVGEDLIAVQSPRWAPAHMVWWLGVVLLQFGAIGLYVRHAEALGRLGLAGLLLWLFGANLTAGILFIQSGAVPLIAASSASIANQLLVGPVFWVLLNEGSFGGGSVLFAIAAMRARVYPRWACWLLILGMGLYLVSWWPADRLLAHTLSVASNLTYGLGTIALGIALWSARGEAVQPRPLPLAEG